MFKNTTQLLTILTLFFFVQSCGTTEKEETINYEKLGISESSVESIGAVATGTQAFDFWSHFDPNYVKRSSVEDILRQL